MLLHASVDELVAVRMVVGVPWWLTVLGWLVPASAGIVGALGGVALGQRRTTARELAQAEQRRIDRAAERRRDAYVALRVATWKLQGAIAAGEEDVAFDANWQFIEAVETVMLLAPPSVRDAANRLREALVSLLDLETDDDEAIRQAEKRVEEASEALLVQMRVDLAGYL
jgi:hypothetical protein